MKIDFFSPIKLEQTNQVKLMNRIDKKYYFDVKFLFDLLYSVRNEYFILEINNKNKLAYRTTYFDTLGHDMYMSHHNGKLNRYKIRKRHYVESKMSFLEIKFKNNKGRTIKKRINTTYNNKLLKKDKNFISSNTPFDSNYLKVGLINQFNRLTLVNKNFKERCTIDLDIFFSYEGKDKSLNNIVIIEIKSDNNYGISSLAVALTEKRIKSSGFSKYCIGCIFSNPTLKQNRFKEKIINIKKIIN